MRHLHSGRGLGVSPPHRKALLRSLTLALIERETIRTTPARAKELRWYADRVVTLAKRGDLSSRRRILQILGTNETGKPGENRVRKVMDRLYTSLVPRFKDRPGGYTQMVRLAVRRAGDNAELCVFRYLPASDEKKVANKKGKQLKTKSAESGKAKDKPAKSSKAKGPIAEPEE